MRPKIKSKEIQKELNETKALRPKNRRLNFTSKISWSDHLTIISKNLLELTFKETTKCDCLLFSFLLTRPVHYNQM